MLTTARRCVKNWLLPGPAKQAKAGDAEGLPARDPGPEAVVRAGIAWLKAAQDASRSADGGVARHFSLVDGWATSYPETTGYIVPTLLRCGRETGDQDLLGRGRRALDWLASIQFPEGGFQGGAVDERPRVPVTFNTGQVLLGLAAGAAEFGQPYRNAMRLAARWLRDSLDPDGCWRRHPSPFTAPGEKAYEIHVSWGLFEAARIAPDEGYAEAGLRQVEWALGRQAGNGWFSDCCVMDPAAPLTHTLGYAFRGLLEAHRFRPDARLLNRACRTADGLMTALRSDGYLPGRLDANWRGTVPWVCLTGTAQVAHCLLLLHRLSGRTAYRDAGFRANAFVRRTVALKGSPGVVGGIKGSFPVDGGYCPFQYPNWAAKFCIDANLLEMEVRRHDAHPGA